MCVCVREFVEGENAADNNGKCLFPASRPGKGFMSDASFAKWLGEVFFFFSGVASVPHRKYSRTVTVWQPKIRRSETSEMTVRFAGDSTSEETEWM